MDAIYRVKFRFSSDCPLSLRFPFFAQVSTLGFTSRRSWFRLILISKKDETKTSHLFFFKKRHFGKFFGIISSGPLGRTRIPTSLLNQRNQTGFHFLLQLKMSSSKCVVKYLWHLNIIIFRPYFIWERKIFKSNGFFLQNLPSTKFIFTLKGVTHRIKLT